MRLESLIDRYSDLFPIKANPMVSMAFRGRNENTHKSSALLSDICPRKQGLRPRPCFFPARLSGFSYVLDLILELEDPFLAPPAVFAYILKSNQLHDVSHIDVERHKYLHHVVPDMPRVIRHIRGRTCRRTRSSRHHAPRCSHTHDGCRSRSVRYGPRLVSTRERRASH